MAIQRADECAIRICEVLGIDSATVRRIILDFKPREPIRVFVELLSSEDVLSFDLDSLRQGAEVTIVGEVLERKPEGPTEGIPLV